MMKNIFGIFKSDEKEHDIHAYKTSAEEKIRAFTSPFEKFISNQEVTSLLLCLSTIFALIFATLPATGEAYKNLIHTDFGFIFGDISWSKDLKFWVNDLLLTLFFFVIGLEIKREFLVGELQDFKKSGLIIVGAIGGMLVPATIYIFLNFNSEMVSGFGIPIATDTAFAVGLLSLFRKKLPKGVFPFITALAIIDDIGAISIIALFYSKSIDWSYLLLALAITFILCAINIFGARRSLPYMILGLIMWYFIERAGIHGTIAGVIVAFTIPARPRRGPINYIDKVKNLINYFEKRKEEKPLILEDPKQHDLVEKIKEVSIDSTTPLQRWENRLEIPITILVLPIFAFFNAGIPVNFDFIAQVLNNSMSAGIILGLLIGKPLGIVLFAYFAVRITRLELPSNTSFIDILALSFFCGIGFTMSIFIADINFSNKLLEVAKLAILIASIFSAIVGTVMVYIITLQSKKSTQF